jgi:hypothetical protein
LVVTDEHEVSVSVAWMLSPPTVSTQGTVTRAEPPTLNAFEAIESATMLQDWKSASALPQNWTSLGRLLSSPSMQAGAWMVYVATPRERTVTGVCENSAVKKRFSFSVRITSTERVFWLGPDVGGVWTVIVPRGWAQPLVVESVVATVVTLLLSAPERSDMVALNAPMSAAAWMSRCR